LACRRQLHAPWQAGKQFDTQLLLQCVDLLAEWWLLQAESGRRSRDMPLFGNHEEIPEMTQLHFAASHIFYIWYAPFRYILQFVSGLV
jgi:hypothetical protein